jgi:CubicO group peptidase (beta-lactamase class C family)
MSANQAFRLSGLAAIISSALSVLAAMVSIVGMVVPVVPDLVVHILLMVNNAFIFFALIGFYGIQYKETGGLGLGGFILAVCGILLEFVFAPLGWLLFLAGLFSFAIANGRTGALPAWGVWLWLLGAVVAILGGILSVSLLFVLGLVTAAGGRAWLGSALWSQKMGSAPNRLSSTSRGRKKAVKLDILNLLILLTLLLGVTACSEHAAPDPVTASTIDPADITLVPYASEDHGFSGVVPGGWVEVQPGIYLAGPPDDRPKTVLIQCLEGGITIDQATAIWVPLLGLEKLPDSIGIRETVSSTWELHTYETVDADLGPRKGDIALAETDDGVYLVALITTPEEHKALHDAIFLPAVDALAPVTDFPSHYQDYAEWPVVAAIEGVGDNVHETVEFTLDACTSLRIYAIGEGSERRMDDFGFIESAATGQVPWQMYYFETTSAGYYRNRRVDRALTLPAGTYRLHFETNGSHSFEDWDNRPPGHRFWGIALYEEPSPEGDPAVCWERPSSPEELGWSSEKLDRIKPELERLGTAALMVVDHGQIVFEWGNTANNFMAHSMRKSLVSALYGIAVDRGTIDMSSTLQELDIDDVVPLTTAEKQATVADLLKARSGVYIPAAGEAASMRADRPDRGSHPPGTFWYYNNWDFNALGTIFDQETGQNVYQAFDAWVAEPIGMQDFFPDDLQYTYEYWLSQHPYYGFRISARDLARFGQLYLQEGEWQGVQLIPADWVRESTATHSEIGPDEGYGYLWWTGVNGGLFPHVRVKEHSYCASGYRGHRVIVLPYRNLVVVHRVNTDETEVNLDDAQIGPLLWLVLDAAGETGLGEPPPILATGVRERYAGYGFSFEHPRGMNMWEFGLLQDGRVDLNNTVPATESAGCVGGNTEDEEVGILWTTTETAPDLEDLIETHYRGAEENARLRNQELSFTRGEMVIGTVAGHEMGYQYHSGWILLPEADAPLYGAGVVGGWYCEESGRAYILYFYQWAEEEARLTEARVLAEFQRYAESLDCHQP